MKKINAKWAYVFLLVLSLLFIIQQSLAYQRTQKSLQSVRKDIHTTQSQSKQYQNQDETLSEVTPSDIRDTKAIQNVGNTFLNDMFVLLPKLDKSNATSKVATDHVVSAFLGATFGGDVDEGTPTFQLENNDIVYSKSADGTGLGFGTVHYRLDNKETSVTLLMHIENGKITELQTGAVKDTSGRK